MTEQVSINLETHPSFCSATRQTTKLSENANPPRLNNTDEALMPCNQGSRTTFFVLLAADALSCSTAIC